MSRNSAHPLARDNWICIQTSTIAIICCPWVSSFETRLVIFTYCLFSKTFHIIVFKLFGKCNYLGEQIRPTKLNRKRL